MDRSSGDGVAKSARTPNMKPANSSDAQPKNSSSVLDDLAGQIEEKLGLDTQATSSTVKSDQMSTTCVLVLGMAGSGKTTFVEKLSEFLTSRGSRPYLVNLDPAVRNVPYSANIDIRDTVNYKAVMQKFGLGPNGGIMTSLNLFTTKFSGVLDLLEKRRNLVEYMLFDTPGQIEVFTWSASGTIITEALGDVFPTVVVYVLDVSASTSPITFMSNMLYACSILYKSKLPFIIALNKIDLADPRFALQWMTDFESFDLAVESEDSYAANLSRSIGLILDEFYSAIKAVPVSAATGAGFPELVEALAQATLEYEKEYKPELDRLKKEQIELRKQKKAERLEKLKKEVVDIATAQSSVAESSRVSIGVFNESSANPPEESENPDDELAEAETFRTFLQNLNKSKSGGKP